MISVCNNNATIGQVQQLETDTMETPEARKPDH